MPHGNPEPSIPYEPHDLDEPTAHEAVVAVIEGARTYPVTPGPTGLFTTARHISLISHLVNRFSDDALHHARQTCDYPALPQHTSAFLTTAAIPLATALVHDARATVPLAALSAPGQALTMTAALDRIELRNALRTHLAAAHRSLTEARADLPSEPTAPSSPADPAPVPPTAGTTNGVRR
ncbi:hypothetical protein [Streptomyces erythrochromogenes]|uniref:hypothetical protein n=1 Tax=Streptomyces erythrochromogenes TaxID=285574 RepID=UPI00382AD1D5